MEATRTGFEQFVELKQRPSGGYSYMLPLKANGSSDEMGSETAAMSGPWQGRERARGAMLALAVCAVTSVITLVWVEHRTLLLWVLLIIVVLAIQQLFQGLREARRPPTEGRD
ncbi:hypothetical protein GCM10027074_35760 [Streptomyces deserti]